MHGLLHERFELIDCFGRGGMGVVYRVRDRERDMEIALKTLSHLDPTTLGLFKQEFRTMTNIVHENLVTLYELFNEDQNWFFTMQLIRGVGFLDYVRREGDSTSEIVSRLTHTIPQLVAGMNRLHQDEIVHRDLKPSNVLVEDDGRLFVLDFGVAIALKGQASLLSVTESISGTLEYISPESIMGEVPGPASDWYSVGVMIYEALTGVLPFSGENTEILYKKVKLDPTPPMELNSEIPPDWNALCLALLDRDPNVRYRASELLQKLSLGVAIQSSFQIQQELAAKVFVGRQQELNTLERGFAKLLDGNSVSLLVGGNSGVGKSALIERFIGGIEKLDDVTVIAGRCYQNELVPFKAFDSLIDSLSKKLAARSDNVELIPRDIAAAVTVFPVLGKINCFADASRFEPKIADRQELTKRATGALIELLLKLSKRTKLVAYIDNLQWGDLDSAEVLSQLLQESRSGSMFFIGSYRVEDESHSPFLKELNRQLSHYGSETPVEKLVLTGLESEQAIQLATGLLGVRSERAYCAELIAQESQGNPFFLRELVRFVDSLDTTENISELFQAIHLRDVLWNRIVKLDTDLFRLLCTVCVSGQPLEAGIAFSAAGFSGENPAFLTKLSAESLIRKVGSDLSIEIDTYHDKVRESVLDRIDSTLEYSIHQALADILADKNGSSFEKICSFAGDLIATAAGEQINLDQHDINPVYLFRISYHYHSCGSGEKALPWSLVAAHYARSISSLEAAREQLKLALSSAVAASRDIKHHISLQLGEVYGLIGEFGLAEEQMLAALGFAENTYQKANTYGCLADLQFKKGELDQAYSYIETAFKEIQENIPSSAFFRRILILREVSIQVWHTMFFSLANPSTKKPSPEDNLRLRLLSLATHVYWFTFFEKLALVHYRKLNVAERFEPGIELASGYAEHGPSSAILGMEKRAIKYGERALQLYKSYNSYTGEAHAFTLLAITLLCFSKYRKTIELSKKGIELVERAGNPWDKHSLMFQLSYSYFCLDQLEKAREVAEELYKSATGVKDSVASRYALDVWAKAVEGDIPEEVLEEQRNSPATDSQATNEFHQAEGLFLLRRGRPAEAVEAFQKAIDVCKKAGITNNFCAPASALYVTALRSLAETQKDSSKKEFTRTLKKAKRALWYAKALSLRYPNDIARIKREEGLLALLENKIGKAYRLINKSIKVAKQREMLFELRQSEEAIKRLE